MTSIHQKLFIFAVLIEDCLSFGVYFSCFMLFKGFCTLYRSSSINGVNVGFPRPFLRVFAVNRFSPHTNGNSKVTYLCLGFLRLCLELFDVFRALNCC